MRCDLIRSQKIEECVFACKFGLEKASFQIAADALDQYKKLFRSIQKVVFKYSGLQADYSRGYYIQLTILPLCEVLPYHSKVNRMGSMSASQFSDLPLFY